MIVHALANNAAPPTGAPDIPVRAQSLSYEPHSPAASMSVPATPHNTPDEPPSHPKFSTLTLPDPDHYTAYDAQVRTLPIEYARAFTAEYNVPDFATRPIISNNNDAIPVFTIAAPTPVSHLSPPFFGLTSERAEGDAQNMGADERPLSPFTDILPAQRLQRQLDRTAPSPIPRMKTPKTIFRKSRWVSTSQIFFPRFFSQSQKV